MALCLLAGLASGKEIIRPAGLEPEIGFWREIFTSVNTTQGLVHDDRYLDVVYERVQLPAEASPAKRRRVADQARAKYRRILETLAGGKRDGLTSQERRVLELWPPGVSDSELRRAARRVRFQQGLSDRFRQGLIRSGQWRDYIRESLEAHGVPLDLAALPHVESSFNPEAHSHVGAAGLWQFTRSTGRRFMQIDHVVDGRRDPFISSDAAAELLSYNYSILKSWPLAITAYNHGVAGMRRAVRKMGTDDIEAIVRGYDGRAFGFASRNFYVAFLAATDAQRDAEKYFGRVQLMQPNLQPVVTTTEYVPVAALVEAFGVSAEALRKANPALLDPVWNGTKHVPGGFGLRIPGSFTPASANARLAAIPADQKFSDQTPDLFHRVQRGDSLSVIAARYRTSVRELMALNGIANSHRIRAGQVLRLPYAGNVQLAAIPEDADTYRVRKGDTLGVIAERSGVPADQLMALNDIGNANRIYPGQELVLRGSQPSMVPEPPAVPVTPVTPERPGDPAPVAAVAESVIAEPGPAATAEAEIPDSGSSVVESIDEDSALPVADATNAEREQALLVDPADYLVASDGSIEVQAAETLGHYADWLELRTQRLRDLNGFPFRQPVVIGRRVKLDFSSVSPDDFAARRIAYHRDLQEAYFTRYRVTDTQIHELRRGESVWLLVQRKYKVPVWLLRQYNPELDLDRVRPGDQIVFPQVERVQSGGDDQPALAMAERP